MDQGRKLKGKNIQLGPSEEDIQVPFARMGPSTNPTVDQLKEMNTDANWGTKNIEIGFMTNQKGQQIMEQTPKHYYDELRRMSKLTGVNLSIHAPIKNLAGLDGKTYNETARRREETRLKQFVDNANNVFDNRPGIINVHASEGIHDRVPYVPEDAEGEELLERKGYVDKESGQYTGQLEHRERYVDGRIIRETPDEIIKKHSGAEGEKKFTQLTKLEEEKRRMENELRMYQGSINKLKDRYGTDLMKISKRELDRKYGKILTKDERKDITVNYDSALNRTALLQSELKNLDEHIKDTEGDLQYYMLKYNENFKRYKKDVEEDRKKILENYGSVKNYFVEREKKRIDRKYGSVKKYIEKKAKEKYTYLKDINEEEYKRRIKRDIELLYGRFHKYGVVYPEDEFGRYENVQDYELGKTSESIKNAAMYGYGKYGKNAPVIAIENSHPEMPFGRPEALLKLITTTRDKVTKELMKKKNMSEKQAEKIAAKLVGGTLDVGHINMLKKYGFTDKKLLKEVEKLTKSGVLKHIHLTDNFGYEDSHLVPGWGNVPVKKYLEELEKRGYKGDFVLEAGGAEALMAQNQDPSQHPLGPAMAYMNTNVYTAQPSGERWTDFADEFNTMYSSEFPTAPRESLYTGYNTSMYGSFTGVPGVLGSQQQGEKKSQFSGSQMA